MCQALDKVPKTVILGVEPEDIDTMDTELTPAIAARVEPMVCRVLDELDRLGVAYTKGCTEDVSCDPLKDCGD